MHAEVKHWVSECEHCVVAKGPYLTARTPMGSITATKPLEVLAMDFTQLEPASDRTLQELPQTLPAEKKRRWPEHLKELCYAYNATPHSTTGYSPFYLMFGREPRLPIDRLVEMEETQGHQPSSRITKHQTELREAHQRAAARLAKEADIRKKRFDCQSRTNVPPIQVGHQVLVRDRTIRGRNKIQDRWSTRVHGVVKQLDNGAYVIEPADGHGSTRVANLAELQVCPPSVLQRTSEQTTKQRS